MSWARLREFAPDKWARRESVYPWLPGVRSEPPMPPVKSPTPNLAERVRELEEFAEAVVRYAGNAGDNYLADKARAVLDQSAQNPYPRA